MAEALLRELSNDPLVRSRHDQWVSEQLHTLRDRMMQTRRRKADTANKSPETSPSSSPVPSLTPSTHSVLSFTASTSSSSSHIQLAVTPQKALSESVQSPLPPPPPPPPPPPQGCPPITSDRLVSEAQRIDPQTSKRRRRRRRPSQSD